MSPFGRIGVKLTWGLDGRTQASAEYDDCKRAARKAIKAICKRLGVAPGQLPGEAGLFADVGQHPRDACLARRDQRLQARDAQAAAPAPEPAATFANS